MKLHIGAGARIEPGWVNIDLGGPPGITKLDVRDGLPYASNSIEMIYTEHFLEHLTLAEAQACLRECYRVLVPGGTIRISVPSLTTLVEKYRAGDVKFALAVGWAPATPCDMLNEGMRFWGHAFLMDAPKLYDVLNAAGFRKIINGKYQKTAIPGMLVEGRPFLGELIVEATKA